MPRAVKWAFDLLRTLAFLLSRVAKLLLQNESVAADVSL